jgi:hypothetical protein
MKKYKSIYFKAGIKDFMKMLSGLKMPKDYAYYTIVEIEDKYTLAQITNAAKRAAKAGYVLINIEEVKENEKPVEISIEKN